MRSRVAAVRTRYDLGGRYVLHTGALVRRKNLPLLVRAFSRYVQEYQDGETLLVLTGRVAPGMPGGADLEHGAPVTAATLPLSLLICISYVFCSLVDLFVYGFVRLWIR